MNVACNVRRATPLSVLIPFLCFWALSARAGAQGVGVGSIQGRVTDETGAALPGVTVTISSPALHGQQR